MYVFGNWTLFGMRHPYFLNALIWFPLLLLGAEHILRGRRGRLFTAAVFLSCISNFYFFYMLVLLTVIYVVWRTLRLYLFPCLFGRDEEGQRSRAELVRAWKQIGRLAVRFLLRGALGTAMGMCLFLPIVLRFIGDPRVTEGSAALLFYPADFYRGIAESFLSFGTKKALEYWTCMGYGALGLLGVLTLFLMPGNRDAGEKGTSKSRYRETHPDLKAAWCCMLAMILLPAAGTVLNGFSYPANRWIWAFSMLTGYIAAVMLPEMGRMPWKRMALLLVCLGIYAAVCRACGADRSVLDEVLLAAAAAVTVRLILPKTEDCRAARQDGGGCTAGKRSVPEAGRAICAGLLLLCTAVGTVAAHGYVCFEVGKRNSDINQYKTDKYIEAMVMSDAAGVRQVVDEAGGETFYRYSARDLANNFSVLHDVSNTQYFWSLSDGPIVQFFTETGQGNELVHNYDNLDNRTMLDEVAGVKYYKRGDGSLLPFGYEKLEGLKYDSRKQFPREESDVDEVPVSSFAVHRNKYALPLGFTSEKIIAKSSWEQLSLPERQEALMQGIVLEDEDIRTYGLAERYPEAELSFTGKELTDLMQVEDGIEIRRTENGGLVFAVLDSSALIRFSGDALSETAGCETSVMLGGIAFKELSGEDAERSEAMRAEKAAAAAADAGAENKAGTAVQTVRKAASIEPVKITVKAVRGGEIVSDKDVSYTLEDNPWATGRDTFLSCCGYSEKPLEEITVKFSRRGVYSLEDLKVVCQPMEAYPAQAEEFRRCVLENLDLHELPGGGATGQITGMVTIPKGAAENSGGRILCIQIPPVRGMQAYVDGEKVPLLQADTMFCALLLEPGTHAVELRYRTPGLAAGAVLSVLAILFFLTETIAGFRRSRHRCP